MRVAVQTKDSTYGLNNLLSIDTTMDSSSANTGNKKDCVTCGCKDTFRDGVRVCGCDTCQKEGCIYKDCVTCGCKDEFRDGERVCWCDACQKDGCCYQEKEKEEGVCRLCREQFLSNEAADPAPCICDTCFKESFNHNPRCDETREGCCCASVLRYIAKEEGKSCACSSGGLMCKKCEKAGGYDDPYDGATYDCVKCKTSFKNKYYNRSTFLCRACSGVN